MSAERPTFSIIIPTYNRPQKLERCLLACTQLVYPPQRFEVIVVNDGGERPLTALITRFAAKILVRLLNQKNQGPAAARNAGAAAAQGAYLAFIDDDCVPAPGWLTGFADGWGGETAVALGGKTVNAYAENRYAAASQLLIDYLYAYYNQPAGTFFTSNNLAVPRTLFEEVGGFDPAMPLAAGEDREFCDRWRHVGYALRYVPAAVVMHYHWLGGASFWRQHFNYGRGAWQFHQIRARRRERPLQVEPFSFYRELLLFPFSQRPK
ncbi:MAG: glycosyltransferase family 2 protein, partial [Anaerolineae bacterium]